MLWYIYINHILSYIIYHIYHINIYIFMYAYICIYIYIHIHIYISIPAHMLRFYSHVATICFQQEEILQIPDPKDISEFHQIFCWMFCSWYCKYYSGLPAFDISRLWGAPPFCVQVPLLSEGFQSVNSCFGSGNETKIDRTNSSWRILMLFNQIWHDTKGSLNKRQ